MLLDRAPGTPLPPERPADQQIHRSQTQPNSPSHIIDSEKRIRARKCCSRRDRKPHPKQKPASSQMRIKGSLRIKIFFFSKCIGKDHDTPRTEKERHPKKI
jgi:hypothetical protein